MNSSKDKTPSSHLCTYEGCNKTFKKLSKLIYHSGKHTGERPFKCNVENCDKSYTNPAHLRRHKKITHDKCIKQESIVCSYDGCLRVFSNKYALKKHENLKHNLLKKFPFVCKECQEGFTRKKFLLQHSYLHTGIPPYKCDQCESRFLTLFDCNRHKRTHKVYLCECGEKFERWAFLLSHKSLCSNVNKCKLSCKTCSETCSNNSNLKIHEKIHLEDDEREVFPCIYENCTRFYFHKKNLNFHINKFHKKNLDQPKIPCVFNECQQMFKTKQYLKSHLKNVHGRKKETKIRKERKDKNVPRKSFAGILAEIDLPANPTKEVIENVFEEVLHNETLET